MKSQILYESVAGLDNVAKIAKQVVSLVGQSAIVLLHGTLAAGKTTLVAAIAKRLGEGSVSSPTFSLQQCYGAKMFHYDFYRVEFEEILALGLLEEFEKSGIHLIEWAPLALKELLVDAGFNLYEIEIEVVDDSSRKYIIKALDA